MHRSYLRPGSAGQLPTGERGQPSQCAVATEPPYDVLRPLLCCSNLNIRQSYETSVCLRTPVCRQVALAKMRQ